MLATRTARLEPIASIQTAVVAELRALLAASGVPDAETRARILISYTLGVLVRGLAQPSDFAALRPEIEALAAITARLTNQ